MAVGPMVGDGHIMQAGLIRDLTPPRYAGATPGRGTMRTTTLARVTGLAIVAVAVTVVAIATVASADDLHAQLSNSANGGPNQATTGTAFPVRFWVVAQPGDTGDTTGQGGRCNPSNGT